MQTIWDFQYIHVSSKKEEEVMQSVSPQSRSGRTGPTEQLCVEGCVYNAERVFPRAGIHIAYNLFTYHVKYVKLLPRMSYPGSLVQYITVPQSCHPLVAWHSVGCRGVRRGGCAVGVRFCRRPVVAEEKY